MGNNRSELQLSWGCFFFHHLGHGFGYLGLQFLFAQNIVWRGEVLKCGALKCGMPEKQ